MAATDVQFACGMFAITTPLLLGAGYYSQVLLDRLGDARDLVIVAAVSVAALIGEAAALIGLERPNHLWEAIAGLGCAISATGVILVPAYALKLYAGRRVALRNRRQDEEASALLAEQAARQRAADADGARDAAEAARITAEQRAEDAHAARVAAEQRADQAERAHADAVQDAERARAAADAKRGRAVAATSPNSAQQTPPPPLHPLLATSTPARPNGQPVAQSPRPRPHPGPR